MYSRLLFIIVFLSALLLASCGMPRIGPMARVGNLDIDGDLTLKGGAGPLAIRSSTSASSLGLDDETVFQPRVDVDWDDLHLTMNGFQTEYSGDGAVQSTLSLGGQIINIGTPVRSDWDIGFYTVQAMYDILPIEVVDVGIGGGVGYLEYDVDIQSKTSSSFIASDDELPFAFLSLRAAKEFGPFEAIGILNGLGIELGDEDFTYYEADVSASYRLFGGDKRQGHVVLGYRLLSMDYEYKDRGRKVKVDDVELKGPYIAFKLYF